MDSGISNGSGVTFNDSLNVFEPRKIDASIEGVSYSEVKPQRAVENTGPIVFEVPGSSRPIVLKDVLLAVDCKLTKADGSNIAVAEQVGPINNVMHTLFNHVEVRLSDTLVSYNHSLYSYQAYMEELLYADPSEEAGRLMMQGFIKDKSGSHDVGDPEAAVAPNVGLKSRRDTFFALSAKATFIGRIHSDVFQQDKCLVEHVPMRVTLHRNETKFGLIKADGNAVDYKITISDATLMVPEVTMGEAMRRSIESRLTGNLLARYNINRTVLNCHLIPEGSSNFHLPALFRGSLPHTVVFAMVLSDKRTANDKKNPFNFEEFALNKIVLSRNNTPVNYSSGLEIPYGNSTSYASGYLNLLSNTNKLGGGALIKHQEFRRGYNLYPFKVVPQNDLYTDASALNEGVLDLKLSFKDATAANVDLFVFAQYNGVVTVDKNRVVKLDTRP